jgi:hypothetical protein
VTITEPLEAPGITIATNVVPDKLIGIAATPPMLIAVGLFRLVPVIVTNVPTGPLLGAKEMMVGVGGMKINPDRAAVPPAEVTLTAPVAPAPTTAEMVVEESTWKDATEVPPSVMAEVPVRLVPVMVMVSPILALVGVKEIIVGGVLGVTVTVSVNGAPTHPCGAMGVIL